MFISLLLVTLLLALLVSVLVMLAFRKPITTILNQITSPEIGRAWLQYLRFAMLVVGVSSGVRIWELEKYITQRGPDIAAVSLTSERWVLELYRALIDTLSGISWLLLVFFVVGLLAYVVVRLIQSRAAHKGPDAASGSDRA